MLIDTHTHFYDEWLLPEAEAAVQRALEAGVGKMIQADVDSRERPAMWEIGNRHPGVIYEMLGLYPGSVDDNWRDELDQVHTIAAAGRWEPHPLDQVQGTFGPGPISEAGPGPASVPPSSVEGIVGGPGPGVKVGPGPKPTFVAIGEIGLDYHEGIEYKEQQKEVLRIQLELAAQMGLPVNIHLRDAWEDLFTILKDCAHLHLRGNLHCFTASYEVYERANRYGDWSVGIGGVVTFKNASLAKTLERIPLHHILLETDAPYLAPVPFRGRRNESAYLPYIAAKVAEVKGLSLRETEGITTDNALKLFNL